MTANLVPYGQFEQLKAQLEDTQESLGAALARIEVFRLREKALVAEIAKLRLGSKPDDAAVGDADDSAPATQQSTKAEQVDSQPAAGTAAGQHQAKQQSTWPMPCYVTEVEENLPVLLINSVGRKTPGSIVITQDYVDFVEVQARVKRNDFVGFAAASNTGKRTMTPSSPFAATWKQFMPSCLSPETGSPQHRGSRGAAKTAAGSFSDSGMGTAADAGGLELQLNRTAGSESGASPARYQSPVRPHSPAAGSLSPRGTGSPAKHLGHSRSAPQHSSTAWHPLHDAALAASGETTGVWQILWRSSGMQQRLTFEATQETREVLHKHTARWLDCNNHAEGGEQDVLAAVAGAAAAGAAPPEGAVELAVPKHLVPSSHTPRLSEPSSILASSKESSGAGSGLTDGVRHIAAAVPARYQNRDWNLVYGTARHGISLQTLYRKAAGVPATVLLVRDTGGYVFGAFCTEPWKPSPRFFGTGETFVFQLEPHKVMFPWKVKSSLKNDFFMYAQQEALGVGGLGAFAIWLDAELLQGSSGSCGTFGSPCLASKEEFRVAAVELWALV